MLNTLSLSNGIAYTCLRLSSEIIKSQDESIASCLARLNFDNAKETVLINDDLVLCMNLKSNIITLEFHQSYLHKYDTPICKISYHTIEKNIELMNELFVDNSVTELLKQIFNW
jgi:hypothetical protein